MIQKLTIIINAPKMLREAVIAATTRSDSKKMSCEAASDGDGAVQSDAFVPLGPYIPVSMFV